MISAVLGVAFVACLGSSRYASGTGGQTSSSGGTAMGGAPLKGGVPASGVGPAGGRSSGPGSSSGTVGGSGGVVFGGGGTGSTSFGSGGSGSISLGSGGSRNGGSTTGRARAAGRGRTGGTTSSGGGGPLVNAGTRASAGCGAPGASGRQDLTVNIRGTERSYRVQFPAPHAASTPLPLIFYFHWLDGTIDDVVALEEPAIWEVGNAAKEAAFVWPQGLAKYNGETGWDLTCGGEDMELFDAILKQLASDRCIDLGRVFATGFSFGADMSNALACCRCRDVVRAVAPASGAGVRPDQSCPAAKMPAIRFSYGTKDNAYAQKDFRDVVAFYRGKLGCSADYDSVAIAPCSSTWTGDSSAVSCACKSYRNCEQPVIDCTFTNMPHTTAAGWRDDTWSFFGGLGAE